MSLHDVIGSELAGGKIQSAHLYNHRTFFFAIPAWIYSGFYPDEANCQSDDTKPFLCPSLKHVERSESIPLEVLCLEAGLAAAVVMFVPPNLLALPLLSKYLVRMSLTIS